LKVGSSFSESTSRDGVDADAAEFPFLVDFLITDEADVVLNWKAHGGKYPFHPEDSSSESEQ
jgi:hypothetical protein